MELFIKKFDELTTDELFEIYRVRTAVFVVEQNCPYQEVDDADKHSYHLFYKQDGNIIAYLRVVSAGKKFDSVSIGRVLSLKRRCGIATNLLKEGISVAKDKFCAHRIELEAQTYAVSLYAKLGFKQVGEEFVEDGIPHIKMILEI